MTTYYQMSSAAILFVMMFVIHGIADYWVQTDWQAVHKSSKLQALAQHTFTYTLSFFPVYVWLTLNKAPNWVVFVTVLSIAIPHALIDTRKPIDWFCEKFKGWPSDNSDLKYELMSSKLMAQVYVRQHVRIELDQKLHLLCLAIVAGFCSFFV